MKYLKRAWHCGQFTAFCVVEACVGQKFPLNDIGAGYLEILSGDLDNAVWL